MSIPSGEQAGAAAVAAPAAPVTRSADDHWPVCRCGHPMHPHKIEMHRGAHLERFKCPRRRWWNRWFHPNVWQPPRQ